MHLAWDDSLNIYALGSDLAYGGTWTTEDQPQTELQTPLCPLDGMIDYPVCLGSWRSNRIQHVPRFPNLQFSSFCVSPDSSMYAIVQFVNSSILQSWRKLQFSISKPYFTNWKLKMCSKGEIETMKNWRIEIQYQYWKIEELKNIPAKHPNSFFVKHQGTQ